MTDRSANNVLLTPELMAYVDGRVAAGQGQSETQVVQAARRFQRRDGRLDHAGKSFLLRLDQQLRGLNDPQQAMNEAASMLGTHLGADRAGYTWIEDDDKHSHVAAEWTTADMPSHVGRHCLNDFGPLLIAALQQGRTVAFENVLTASLTYGVDVAAAFAAANIKAVIAVPLVKSGRWRACLYVHQRTPRGWTKSEEGLVREVAERTWVVVERAHTETALRASEQRFHELADNISQFAWTADASGWIYWYNQRWHDYTGMTLQQMEGWGWTKVHHPDHVDSIVAAFSEALRTGEPYEGTFPLRSKDGEYRWFLTRVLPIRNDEGHIVRWFGTNTDVTALRETRDALRDLNETLKTRIEEARASEKRFHELANNISQHAWTSDANGERTWYNQRWYDYSGASFQEMEGGGWAKFHHPDHIQRFAKTFSDALRTGQPFEDTLPLRSESGEYRWFLTRALPIRNDEGHIVRWFGTNTDVTALRHTKDILRELNETLESRVEAEVATRLKTEETLRQSQKMEVVGQLTGGIAHDFNNLLQGVSGSLEMLQARIAQGRVAEAGRYVSTAMTSVERAGALTQRLLTFSRRQPLDPRQVNANPLVAGMEDLIRRAVGPAIEVEVVLAGGLWMTLCDAHQLENALLNLAINARDAMPNGGRLVIETANACLDDAYAQQQGDGVEPGQYVSISMTDTGIGMPADVARRAFEPFFTTKPVGQGTGLGLSMLYGFSKQSHGHARIHSEQGRGTTVLLYLPRERGSSAGRHDDADADGAEQAEACQTVLVVEDDAAVRMLVTEALGDEGYHVLEAQDGPSGLQALMSATPVDLLLADMGLPGMNGRELAAAARERRPDLKVLFITGHSYNAAVGRGVALEPGMALISKPFALASLVTKVRAVIEG